MGFLIQQRLSTGHRWCCPVQRDLIHTFDTEDAAWARVDRAIELKRLMGDKHNIRVVTGDDEVPIDYIAEQQKIIDGLKLEVAKRDALLADLGIPFTELDDIYQHADDLAKGAAASPLGAKLDAQETAMYAELMKITDEVRILAGDPGAIKPKPVVETREATSCGLMFRLVAKDGRATAWCSYAGVAYLDGWATATDYYLADGTKFPILTADEMLKFISAGEASQS